MTKEELIEFLKENLRIKSSEDYGMYTSGNSKSIELEIKLGEETICSTCFDVTD